MPSESPMVPAQTEKPLHYMYLKEFRTTQCPLFLQHKCTQHRPYTCYRWHFMNQRRRRPVRRRDGTFNYSPDVYCTKYDETTGVCPDGDDCPFLHRTAGDTERRYHLRYYKTGTCVYETDSKGNCVKNGPHCAFAHGANDLRPPAYDVRELQSIDVDKSSTASGSSSLSQSGTPSSLEKEKILAEDPRWNDTNYVLANYKTEQCKRPPRLCRQGYACPSNHNSRDRRRSPKKHKYRSTPCPNVKHGDDWGDPMQCENGDTCAYCHTRTEQQFHPEIYKSTKCNDMVQTGYCPRGPFCAFAHVEQEITTDRNLLSTSENSLAAFVSTVLPSMTMESGLMQLNTDSIPALVQNLGKENQNIKPIQNLNGSSKFPDPIGKERGNSFQISNNIQGNANSNTSSPMPEPIGKGRSGSTSSSINSELGSPWFCQKAPGSERDDLQAKLWQQLSTIDNDNSLEQAEKLKRKQNLVLVHSMSQNGINSIPTLSTSLSNSGMHQALSPSSIMSPLAPAFYPTGDNVTMAPAMSTSTPSFYPAIDTVESVIGHALGDLNLDDIDVNSIDKDVDKDNDTNSLSSSLSAGIPSSGFGPSSVPIGIPPGGLPRGSISSLSQSPPSPYGSFNLPILSMPPPTKLESEHSSSYLNNKFSYSDFNSMSPRNGPGGPHSPLYSSSSSNLSNSAHTTELQKLKDDFSHNKTRLEHWEQAYTQAKCACEAWKKEAEESLRKAKYYDDERLNAVKQRDEAIIHAKRLQQDVDTKPNGPQIRFLQRVNELPSLGIPQLQQLHQQLTRDLKTLDGLIVFHQQNVKCMICLEKDRTVTARLQCNHQMFCEMCVTKIMECPVCHTHIQRPSTGYNRL
ncbi:RING finger protein unkempt homolog [Mizuhopecten yessoensis]|uniref:RING finger protein unkempt homolog n=1 Tax=Mizuhopecten yessoensis TaxID=6573 RepID=UPI000B45DF62|nr:RING finger protein unkempt homolog [Mizuhopecten yessoensis]